jgi:hypothetical protein
MLRIVLASLAGIAGAALGWGLLAAIVIAVGHLAAIRDVDGGFSMTAFFMIGPIGGLFGFFAASILVLRRLRSTGAGTVLASMPFVVIIAAALVGAVVAGMWHTRPLVTSNALPPELVFEIRLPPGMAPPGLVSRSEALARRSPIELRTPQNTMSAEIVSVRDEAGRAIASGRVEMHFRVAERHLVVRHPAGMPDVVFRLALGRSPTPGPAFGPWQPDRSNRQFELRYRVVQDGD